MKHDFLNCEKREVLLELFMIEVKLLSSFLSWSKTYSECFSYEDILFNLHTLNIVTLNDQAIDEKNHCKGYFYPLKWGNIWGNSSYSLCANWNDMKLYYMLPSL